MAQSGAAVHSEFDLIANEQPVSGAGRLELSLGFDDRGEDDLEVLWGDGERVFSRGRRLGADGNPDAVLIVRPAAEHPSPASLNRLAHEYGLKGELDSPWAVRPLAFVREHGRSMLVLEDPGGEPLEGLLGVPLNVASFLRLASGIAAAVGKLHQHGLVHKDIKPANILVNCTDGQVRLTGFSIASRLPRERQAPAAPETIAGTLAYMAPEQTGRMNRSIDSRSDLYALGVTFYQMLTGQLPFTASDPMEWVHCHVARRPVPPAERLKSVPGAISAIIVKLLAKTAEDRYQTAAGLESDLRHCLVAWEAQRRIDDFPLGEHDTPDRLLILEKLYGRGREVETLLAAFDRIVKSGAPELVLVSGYSGIGKSAVVNELHRALVPPRGLFAAGKFDQYKRDIPYSTLVQAFQSLVRPLLSKSDVELASWREALLQALGANGRLIVDLLPELKLIIGDQPPVPELPPQDAQRRFQLVFRRFIGVFARPEHPLALFLDDLQWLDAATLDLLEDLLTRSDLQHLLLIGAYRDNEVDSGHPLTRKLDAIKTAGAKINEITLAPLTREYLGQLLADALRCDPGRAAPLAQLVHEKTGGNPFFAIQFISSLAEEGLLTFDHGGAGWSWDLDRIQARGYTDNVADLMAGKLTRLPEETQKALWQAACLGNVADIPTLAVIRGTSEDEVHAALWEAVRLELVERQPGSYRFVHDRIQEAAYSLIPEEQRPEAHLRIGRLLAAQIPAERRDEAIFDIVNHLNRGAALITEREEREQLAEFNLIAGKRARAATAYSSALSYLTAGAALLPEDAWILRQELAFALEFYRAECEFLTGNLTEAEARLADLTGHALSLPDRSATARLQVDLFMTLGRSDRAVAVGLGYLRLVGIAWSEHPTPEDVRQEYERMWQHIGERAIEALTDLPRMADPVARATMDVLTALVTPALFTDQNLRALVIGRMGNLSLEHGNSEASCYAYVAVGTVLGLHFGDYQAAYRFGRLGLALVEQPGMDRLKARVYVAFGNLGIPSWRHVGTGRSLAQDAFDTALQAGDLTYAAFAKNYLLTGFLWSGTSLVEVQREAEAAIDFARRMRFGVVVAIITAPLRLARMLRGLTPTFGSFDGAGFDAEHFEQDLRTEPSLAVAACLYWIRVLQARVLAGDHAAAVVAAREAERLLWILPAIFEHAEFHFYGALTRAALAAAATGVERAAHLEALVTHHHQLQIWAQSCPDNFADRAALVGAEIARIEDRDLDAMRLYERAIRSARENGFVHTEAIAYERASAFYRARGFDEFAEVYLRDARRRYLTWGADGKVRQLDRLYPQLRQEERAPAPIGTIDASLQQLDVATVIKVSQAVSGEIVLEKLIDTLMRIAIEQAGAERGVLVLSRDRGPRIAAAAATSGDTTTVHVRDEAVSEAALPESVLHYVVRTRDSVILDDASAESAFAEDPYIRQRQARSVLCLPLLNQASLIGVLYLENNLAPGVFAPARIAVLRLLASQAAISLENTRLYRDLAEREARIRRLVDANIIGVFTWQIVGETPEDRDVIFQDVNDAFLRIVGYDREELVAGSVGQRLLTAPEWEDRTRQAMAEMATTGAFQPYEKEYIRKDGSRVPVLIGAARDGQTGDQGVAFVLDLTEQKRAEAALRESEEQWKAVFENSPTMYFVVDAAGTIISVNPSGAEQLGYKVDELIGRPVRILFHENDREMALKNKAICLEYLGRTMSWELRKLRKDGSTLWARETGRAMSIQNRRVVLIVSEDVSERKHAEDELQRTRDELARVSRVTTLGELTAAIAHEVNQPLTGLVSSGNAGLRWLAADPPDLEAARRAVERMIRDGTRAAEVISRIRALVKKSPVQRDSLNVNDVVAEVLSLVQTEIQRNGIALRTNLTADLPLVLGDRIQLQQVILNLIVNANEALSAVIDGPRELMISSTKNSSNDVLVTVSDSGQGFDGAKLENIFDAFYTTKPEGMGIGLAVSRSIMEAHGGKLWATPNEPRGAVLQFSLPTADDRHADDGALA